MAKKGIKEEQFDKGQARPKGKLGSKPNGGSEMEDEQFNEGASYNGANDDGDASAGKKTKGGMKLEAGELSPAHKIMSAIVQAVSKPHGSMAKNKVSEGDESDEGSAEQSKAFKKSGKIPKPNGKIDQKKDKK